MLPNKRFLGQSRDFWAHVKLISQHLGHSRGQRLMRFTIGDALNTLQEFFLKTDHLAVGESITNYGNTLVAYLNYRADQLEQFVAPNLMTREEAEREFHALHASVQPTCSLPMNKQKGEKRHYAYLTCIVNMLTEHHLRKRSFDDSPRSLIIVTKKNIPLRTLSRWMDGAYPSVKNPIAVWEIKEYYGTTTFGSRVADGVYETMLDGEEFRELREHEKIHVLHYLMVDDRYTWWVKGKSYVCRILDMLHMGLVDEVLFGREVLARWPKIVKSWPLPRE